MRVRCPTRTRNAALPQMPGSLPLASPQVPTDLEPRKATHGRAAAKEVRQ
jgi:hypothetical protein